MFKRLVCPTFVSKPNVYTSAFELFPLTHLKHVLRKLAVDSITMLPGPHRVPDSNIVRLAAGGRLEDKIKYSPHFYQRSYEEFAALPVLMK